MGRENEQYDLHSLILNLYKGEILAIGFHTESSKFDPKEILSRPAVFPMLLFGFRKGNFRLLGVWGKKLCGITWILPPICKQLMHFN